MLSFALISDDEKYFILGWTKFVVVYLMENLNIL